MELFAPAHLGVGAAHAARAPVQKPPDTSRIDATENSGKASADSRQLSQNADNSANMRAKRQAFDQDAERPAGPPPSFEVSLLEVEQDLQKVIARMEVSRGKERDADAVKVDETVEDPKKAAENQSPKLQEARPPADHQANNPAHT